MTNTIYDSNRSKKIITETGLFFGSFNPIHSGHLMMAQYFVEYTDLQQVWFVVSPQNPLKKKASLLPQHHRLNMVKAAIENHHKFRASDIEFAMPQPSYTINTLTYLKEKYPEKNFYLLIGADNLANLSKWKNYEEILNNFKIFVYKRFQDTINHQLLEHPHVSILDAPQIEISSSFIRAGIKKGKDMQFFLHENVYAYIKEMYLYQ